MLWDDGKSIVGQFDHPFETNFNKRHSTIELMFNLDKNNIERRNVLGT